MEGREYERKGWQEDSIEKLVNVMFIESFFHSSLHTRLIFLVSSLPLSLPPTLLSTHKQYQAEQELISQAQRRGFTYTLIRVGPLRGGGGEEGLGFDFYDQRSSSKFQTLFKNPLSVLDNKDEHFDATQRGFTFSYEDNLVFGDTGRILAAETMIKALGSAHVEDVAISLVSEQGRTWPNFQVAPWDLF